MAALAAPVLMIPIVGIAGRTPVCAVLIYCEIYLCPNRFIRGRLSLSSSEELE
jgi:hypothetical protein